MLRTRAIESEVLGYTEAQEEKDVNKFGKFIDGLSNVQLELLLIMVLDQYSDYDLSYILDYALEFPLKDELGDLWNFRKAHKIGDV